MNYCQTINYFIKNIINTAKLLSVNPKVIFVVVVVVAVYN